MFLSTNIIKSHIHCTRPLLQHEALSRHALLVPTPVWNHSIVRVALSGALGIAQGLSVYKFELQATLLN